MSAKKNYWEECIAIAAEECELALTPYQLEYLAGAVENGHEHYGQAFYSPPSSDRINVIEQEAAEKFKQLQAEFDAYRSDAETAVKKAQIHAHADKTAESIKKWLRHQ